MFSKGMMDTKQTARAMSPVAGTKAHYGHSRANVTWCGHFPSSFMKWLAQAKGMNMNIMFSPAADEHIQRHPRSTDTVLT